MTIRKRVSCSLSSSPSGGKRPSRIGLILEAIFSILQGHTKKGAFTYRNPYPAVAWEQMVVDANSNMNAKDFMPRILGAY